MELCVKWINDNNGFIMCVITAVYVIATIAIMYFNKKSAKAATEQLIEMKNQQKQNVGIQLYEKRKEIASNFNAEDYNKYYWDFKVLFPSDLFDEFTSLGLKKKLILEWECKKHHFESHLKDYDIEAYNKYKDLERYYNDGREEYKLEIEEFLNLCDQYAFTEFYVPDAENVGFDMRSILEEIDKRNIELGIEELNFSIKLQSYLKNTLGIEN